MVIFPNSRQMSFMKDSSRKVTIHPFAQRGSSLFSYKKDSVLAQTSMSTRVTPFTYAKHNTKALTVLLA